MLQFVYTRQSITKKFSLENFILFGISHFFSLYIYDMPRASSRTLSTVVTARRNVKRRGKLGRTISSRTLLATTSLLSEAYGLSPCSCNDDALEIENSGQASLLSRSSNAFWHRKSKSSGKKQQRNNSTASESQTTSSKTFRQSFVERWKRNKKKSPTMITARTILRKRTNTKTIAQKQNSIHPLTTTEISVDPPSLTQGDTLHSSLELDRLASQDNSNADDDDANPTLEPTTASCLSEQQNINATNNTHRSTYETSQSTIHDHNSSEKTKSITSRTNRSKTKRPMPSRSTMHSSKRKKPKRITKRKTKKKRTSTSKRNNSRRFLSKNRRKIFPYSPFPDPNLFHSIPPMKDS